MVNTLAFAFCKEKKT